MVVDLVLESGCASLVEAAELVKADRVSIRHDEPVKRYGKAHLPEGVNLGGVAQDFAAGGDQNVLAVVRVHIV